MSEPGQPLTLAALARHLHAELVGDPAFVVSRPASLERATANDVSFFADRRRDHDLERTAAGAVILAPADRERFSRHRLLVADPYPAFVEACRVLLAQAPPARPGLHPAAQVDPAARLGAGVCADAHVVVGAGAVLGENVRIGANTVIGADVVIGADTRIAAGVIIYPGCHLGARCRVESGVVIGSPGFGYLPTDDGWLGVPQIGSVRIGDDVDIGANTTIDRGALDDTVIENGVKLDNQIQVAHNVFIGEHTAIAACTGIAGSARIGRRCRIGGRASIVGHLVIADDVTISATSMVTRSIESPGHFASNLTAHEVSKWRRILARLAHLDDLFQRVRSLERAAGEDADRR